jgi:hypothetical protein
MKKIAGILGASLAGASLLAWVASSAAGASYSGPRHRRGGGRGGAFSVAEPASIALLGAGLIALGIFAKHKNGKNGKKS